MGEVWAFDMDCKLIHSVGSHKQQLVEYPVDGFWPHLPKTCKAMQFNTRSGFLFSIQKYTVSSNRAFKICLRSILIH